MTDKKYRKVIVAMLAASLCLAASFHGEDAENATVTYEAEESVADDEGYAPEDEDTTVIDQSSKKKDKGGLDKQVYTSGDSEGLIDDDGSSKSKSAGEDLEEVLKREEEENRVKIPGFYVDPSKYPAANVTLNTGKIYVYLTEELELNHAAATGLLANVQMESNFRPLALGDGGTSYGICQWHLDRFVRLMNYCKNEGLDYNTLEGQLEYLKYELNGGYKGVYEALKEIPDNAQGAWNAAYLFCMRFEMPDQTEARSMQRGNLAKTEFYPREAEEFVELAQTDEVEDESDEDETVWAGNAHSDGYEFLIPLSDSITEDIQGESEGFRDLRDLLPEGYEQEALVIAALP